MSSNDLKNLREQIDDLDEQLLSLLAQRLQLTEKVGLFKECENLPIVDAQREQLVIQRLQQQAMEAGAPPQPWLSKFGH